MKQIILLLLLLPCLRLSAQLNSKDAPQISYFNPEHDPVAIRSDTALQLLVSEYVLAKSVQARLGSDCQVAKISKVRAGNEAESLVIEGVWISKDRQHFALGIPLIPDVNGRLYYASNQALLCSSLGCNNCSIQNGHCIGCCLSSSGSSVGLPGPLLKVSITIDQ
jgi:hypothetical protein